MEIEQGRVLNSLPAMVWTARADGQIDFVNRRWSEYTGLGLGEALGQGWQAAIDPKHLPTLLERWRSILASGEPGEMEARLRRVDGKLRWFLIHCSPTLSERGHILFWYGINTDIDQRKLAEQAHSESEAKLAAAERDLRLTIDTIPVFIAAYSADGTRTFVNQSWQDYCGLSVEDATGRDAKTFPYFHPDDLERNDIAWRASLASGEPLTISLRVRRADGQYRWHISRRVPLRDENGNVIRWYSVAIDIDDQKRAEEALRQSEHNFRLIIDTIPALAWAARPDGTAEFFNQHYLAYLGLTTEEAQDWGWATAVHPDDMANIQGTWKKILTSGAPGEAEARLRRSDGAYRWFLFRVDPLRDETGQIVKWYGTNTDIDDRKRTEDALRRSEAFLAEGQNLARIGNFSWHIPTGEILWSEPLYRIFEIELGTPITLDLIASRLHPDDKPRMADMFERAQRGESGFEYEHSIILPDHSIKHLHLIAHRAPNALGQIEYIAAVLDVTQRRNSEEALEKVRSELAHLTRIMSLGALTASIAHEVNQPLSGIITNAGTCMRMLASNPPNLDGARETARRTIRDGNRAAQVITRLRELFSRRTPIPEPVDLNAAAQEVVALLWGDLQRRRVILRTELAEGLPPVGGDRVQIQQVIMNLMRNASDSLSDVDDRPRRLLVRTQLDLDDHVRLSVEDVGVGFQAGEAERMFEAFYTTKSDGMGIGLSVSRSIVESHKGRLWAKANEAVGVTVSFSLPAYSEDEMQLHNTDTMQLNDISSAGIRRGFS